MPAQQQSITQFLVPIRSNENDNERNDVDPMQAVMNLMERMCQHLETVSDKIVKMRSDMNERIMMAESTVVEANEEVSRLRSEVLVLRNALNQRPRHTDDGAGDRDEGDEGDGNGTGHDHQQVLPQVVSSNVLMSMINNHQRLEDGYWRSSLMITIGSGEFGTYKSWLHKLRTCGLHFLLEGVRSHYITGRGNLRLTFATEFEMRKALIRARKYCKEKRITNIHVEFLLPPRYVRVKKAMMRYGRQLKMNQNITSYDSIMKGGEPVLRTFHHSVGVRYWTLQELEQQQHTRQYDSGDGMTQDEINQIEEEGDLLLDYFNPVRDLPPISNQDGNRSNV